MYGLGLDKKSRVSLLQPSLLIDSWCKFSVCREPPRSDVLVRKSLQMREMGSVFASIIKGDKRRAPQTRAWVNARHVLSDSPKA